MPRINGMSLYGCDTCEWHFAIEHGGFADENEPSICPICQGKNIDFKRDIEVKGGVNGKWTY